VAKGGTVVVPLSNLSPFSPITVSASNKRNKAKTPDVVLPVIPQPAAAGAKP
jgi:hypothetical protein